MCVLLFCVRVICVQGVREKIIMFICDSDEPVHRDNDMKDHAERWKMEKTSGFPLTAGTATTVAQIPVVSKFQRCV